ncbi:MULTISPECIES: hypothetical protein [Acidiphilium]|uniref:Uncharacterized protein n=1 Tax=Acidiphilium rubrum TaxID=526 RepID=A0A8G2FLS0_ACIRU|nr:MULTISPECIES: hypothetical protein [Acidiphilium]MCW8308713.1 hypothetical protein [Acidiphilium sp. PA]SIR54053.1 hypothetical protein SAMN05421828_1502 [Acidiphilium rubrum]
MRKLIQTMTFLAALGALAPFAAQAGQPGLTMYQPGPLIVHTPQRAKQAIKAAPAQEQFAVSSDQPSLTIYQPYPMSARAQS